MIWNLIRLGGVWCGFSLDYYYGGLEAEPPRWGQGVVPLANSWDSAPSSPPVIVHGGSRGNAPVGVSRAPIAVHSEVKGQWPCGVSRAAPPKLKIS